MKTITSKSNWSDIIKAAQGKNDNQDEQPTDKNKTTA